MNNLKISGLKCDKCSFKDDDIKIQDYIYLVNKPCPACGSNLLTEQDFRSVQLLAKIANNPIVKFLDCFFGFLKKIKLTKFIWMVLVKLKLKKTKKIRDCFKTVS